MNWISVKNKLPEEYSAVLVTDGKEIFIGHYEMWSSKRGTQEFWRTEQEELIDFITHWMPLPSLPEEK